MSHPTPGATAGDIRPPTAPERSRRRCPGPVAAAVGAAAVFAATLAGAGPADASHGSLDPSFDGDGRVSTSEHAFRGVDVASLPDGRVLAAAGGTGGVTLTRFGPTGAVDASFGSAGKVTVPDMGEPRVLVQPDGRIVLAGTLATGTTGDDFAVFRFLPDGAPDTGFGTGGRVTTEVGTATEPAVVVSDRVAAAALHPDGRIVVGGATGQLGVFDVALVRYTPGGALDTTFGGDGKVVTDFGAAGMNGADDLAVQPDGRVVVLGWAETTAAGAARLSLARYTAAGALDTTFDADGVLVGPSGHARALALQADGRIVVAGGTDAGGSRHATLLRYLADGAPDRSFDGDGAVVTAFGDGSSAFAVAVRPDGRIVTAGYGIVGGRSRFAVASHLPSGALDPTFDGDGKTTTDIGPQPDAVAEAVALQADGRIVAAGSVNFGGRPSDQMVLARYLAAAPPHRGYWLVASDGGVFAFGDAPYLGSTGGMTLARPVVGMAGKPGGDGYWLVAADGGVFAFGAARFAGSTGAQRLNRPIAGMAATPSGLGYWLVASDGGVFAFGDAVFHGSTGAIRLASPVVGMAATPSGRGYWLVAADGGVFAFGDAQFHGSTGGLRLASPVVGMAADPDGEGYRLVAADGGVFAFKAGFFGSTGALRLASPVVGMTASSSYDGYWTGAADGGVFAFGTHPFAGSTGAIRLARPVVGVAARE
jgi:uncharacterized delta-60 repeat protein